MKQKHYLASFKIILALLGLSAMVYEIIYLIQNDIFVAEHYVSYFTNISNMLAAAVLLLSATMLLRGQTSGQRIVLLRGAITLYLVMTGVIYHFLLSDTPPNVVWVNAVLHYIMPAVLLLDWIIDRPAVRVKFSQALLWLVFPVGYLLFSIVRGAITGWYPYPFLTPTDGYGPVVMTCLAIAVIVVIGTRIMIIGRKA